MHGTGKGMTTDKVRFVTVRFPDWIFWSVSFRTSFWNYEAIYIFC